MNNIQSLQKRIKKEKARTEILLNSLKELLAYAERNTCTHEETYRGGSIWEICSACGTKWADDQGGKPCDTLDFPKEIQQAQEVVDSMTAHKK